MSKLKYETEDPDGQDVEVLAGWDHHLDRYFLLIAELNEPGGQVTGTLVSLLDREDTMALWEITATLHAHGLAYPETWLRGLISDRIEGRGNYTEHHGRHPRKSTATNHLNQ
jgi:hypothetical protein